MSVRRAIQCGVSSAFGTEIGTLFLRGRNRRLHRLRLIHRCPLSSTRNAHFGLKLDLPLRPSPPARAPGSVDAETQRLRPLQQGAYLIITAR